MRLKRGGEWWVLATEVLLSMILVAAIAVLASVPPVSRDALVHHLAVPKLWLEHGSIYEMPGMEFSYYPMTLDLLYLIPLYFGNDIIPKFIHFAFALATSGMIFIYLRNRLNTLYGMLGALFFLSTPIIVKLSTTAYVDLGLVFFATAGLLSALKWREELPEWNHLALAALCCGMAVSIKYNGLIVLMLLGFIVAHISLRSASDGRQTTIRSILATLLFFVIAGLVYSPWGIKNFLWTGNPVFPLFDGLFNSSDPFEVQSVPPLVLRKLIYNETWWETALVPIRIFFQGMDDSPRYFDGKLNPALLVLPIMAFVKAGGGGSASRYPFEKRSMVIFSVLFILVVFFQTNMRTRYVAPAIPCLVILTMFGLRNSFALVGKHLVGNMRRAAFGALLLVTLLIFSGNVQYIVEQFRIAAPLQYLTDEISRDRYIEKFRPEYAAIRYANNALPSDAVLLSLFIGRRGYYLERQTLFDIDLFHAITKRSESKEALRINLAQHGFTHLLIRYDLFYKWSQDNLKPSERHLVSEFLKEKSNFLFAKNGHRLYQLQ